MKKRYWIPGVIVLALVITYFSGPRIPHPTYNEVLPDLPGDLSALENYVAQREKDLPVREDNQARILWQGEDPKMTEYSVVYLHGFGGSYRDGYPVNVQVADTLDANLYVARLAGHGLKPPASLDSFSPENAWESAKEALAIGNKIGKKVIILSTSTGGTLALKLAATYPDAIYAIINMSPNIEDDIDFAYVLNSPWGYEIAKLISFGDSRKIEHEKQIAAQYWDTIYPSRALVDLQVLLGTTMKPETFQKIEVPTQTLFYYENMFEEDDHVEVEVYPEVHKLLSTPDPLKELVKLETPKTHFIGSAIKSKNTEVVFAEIVEFLRENLEIEALAEEVISE